MWTDNDFKHVDPREHHQIWILSQILDHFMIAQQNKQQVTKSLLMMVSAPLQMAHQTENWIHDAQGTSHNVNISHETLFV